MTDGKDDDNGEGAKKAKKEAMRRVERNANPEWRLAADAAVLKTARELPFFSMDDVVKRMPKDAPGTHEYRAWGPVMQAAARAHVIEKAPLPPVNCTRRNCHGAPITVWKSLIFGKAAA